MEMNLIRMDKEYQAHFMEIKSIKIKIGGIGRDKLPGLRDKYYKPSYLCGSNI